MRDQHWAATACMSRGLHGVLHEFENDGIHEDVSPPLVIKRVDAFKTGLSKLRRDAQKNVQWMDELYHMDVDFCSERSDLMSMLHTAPTEFTKGMLYGKLTLRMQWSARHFNGAFSETDRKLTQGIESKLTVLNHTFPDWFDSLDFHDPDFCCRHELEDMLQTAPVDFLQGMLFGKLTLRIEMEPLVQRGFSLVGSPSCTCLCSIGLQATSKQERALDS